MTIHQSPISSDDLVLVTGAGGFLGSKVIEKLLCSGYLNLRCFVRTAAKVTRVMNTLTEFGARNIDILCGNLAYADDCQRAVKDVAVVINCAAGMSGGLVNMFTDSVISARNLLSALHQEGKVKRIVHVSSVAVYETASLRNGELLEEDTELESHHVERNDPYSYTKTKQEQLIWKLAGAYHIPFVVIRPGVIFGPGGTGLHGRVGFRYGRIVFHLGGSNILPLTYLDNCAEAIVLAATKPGVENAAFNIVDDELPTSKAFLRRYMAVERNSRSVRVPYSVLQLLAKIIAWYALHSGDQIPPFLTPHRVDSIWKDMRFDNEKAKKILGWVPRVPMSTALSEHFEYLRSIS